MKQNAIFIGATGQNVGKTTLCLGIISGLEKRFDKVGFIKPVGQRHVKISENLSVDKDVVLFKEQFALKSKYSDMSPVIIPPGFTRKFLNNEFSIETIKQNILRAFKNIQDTHAFTVVEGTGHIGVGSIVEVNNAKIAALLGLDMVIIASGGLGSAFDELALNVMMCKAYGVKVRGVILNRVLKDKRDMILEYFPKALKQWNIPLIGCIPYSALLSTLSMRNFESLFSTTMLSGEQHRFRLLHHIRMVAGSLESYQNSIKPNELIITPATRDDIIIATLEHHLHRTIQKKEELGGGMILTGTEPPNDWIVEQIQHCHIPVLYAPLCSYEAMKRITSYTCKIRKEDTEKVDRAIQLVEQNVQFDCLCHDPKNSSSTQKRNVRC